MGGLPRPLMILRPNRHRLLLSFDPDYKTRYNTVKEQLVRLRKLRDEAVRDWEKHEFIRKWIDEHVKPWHETFRENFGPVLFPSWLLFLFSKNPLTMLIPMFVFLLGCFYFQFQRRKNSRRLAESIWKEFPDFGSKKY